MKEHTRGQGAARYFYTLSPLFYRRARQSQSPSRSRGTRFPRARHAAQPRAPARPDEQSRRLYLPLKTPSGKWPACRERFASARARSPFQRGSLSAIPPGFVLLDGVGLGVGPGSCSPPTGRGREQRGQEPAPEGEDGGRHFVSPDFAGSPRSRPPFPPGSGRAGARGAGCSSRTSRPPARAPLGSARRLVRRLLRPVGAQSAPRAPALSVCSTSPLQEGRMPGDRGPGAAEGGPPGRERGSSRPGGRGDSLGAFRGRSRVAGGTPHRLRLPGAGGFTGRLVEMRLLGVGGGEGVYVTCTSPLACPRMALSQRASYFNWGGGEGLARQSHYMPSTFLQGT